MPDLYLKTQQVADALQMGVSTVKRWVDAEQMGAIRTSGGHRLIPLSEAFRFAKARNLPTDGLNALADMLIDRPEAAMDESARIELLEHLKLGHEQQSRTLIVAAHARLGTTARLCDELIQPLMEQIGEGWRVGTWNIYEEHQASRIVERALNDIANTLPRYVPVGLALGATVPGDNASIALLAGELTLREIGWDVRNLGANLPFSSLAEAVRNLRPALVYLTICHLTQPVDEFLGEYSHFHKAADSIGALVILGGRALSPEIRAKLPYTCFGDRMSHLSEFGQRILALLAGSRSGLLANEIHFSPTPN